MQSRPLGTSGVRVSLLGLGGDVFASAAAERTACRRLVHDALDRGVTFIDTAPGPRGRRAEMLVGDAVRGRRDRVVLATKFHFRGLTGSPGERVREHCEQSLRVLGTDRIDLFQVHAASDLVTADDLLTTLADLRDEGKIVASGACGYPSWRVAESYCAASTLGVAPFAGLQHRYNLLHREPERELVDAVDRYVASLLPVEPLAAGLLAGSAPGATLHGDTVAALAGYAGDHGHTVAELAVAWLAAKPVVGSVLLGMRTAAEIETGVRGVGWRLTASELAEIDALADGDAPVRAERRPQFTGRRYAGSRYAGSRYAGSRA